MTVIELIGSSPGIDEDTAANYATLSLEWNLWPGADAVDVLGRRA